MSIALIQNHNHTIFQQNPTFNITSPSIGNLLVVCITVNGSNVFPSSITDSDGNTYINISSSNKSLNPTRNATTSIWYSVIAFSSGGGLDVTVHFPSPVTSSRSFTEWSGINPTSPFESGNGLTSSSGNPLGPVLSSTNAVALFIAAINASSSATGVSSPWINLSSDFEDVAYLISSLSGSYQANYTPLGSVDYTSSGAVFRSADVIVLNLFESLTVSDALILGNLTPMINSETLNMNDSVSFVINRHITLTELSLMVDTIQKQIDTSTKSEEIKMNVWLGLKLTQNNTWH